MGLEFGGIGLYFLVAGLLFSLFAPWVGMAVPAAKRALNWAALGFLLFPIATFLSALLYAFPWGAQLTGIISGGLPIALANCALAAAVVVIAKVATDKQETR